MAQKCDALPRAPSSRAFLSLVIRPWPRQLPAPRRGVLGPPHFVLGGKLWAPGPSSLLSPMASVGRRCRAQGSGVRPLTWGAQARELQEAASAARGPRARGPREGASDCAGGGCGAPARSCQARPPRAGLATRAVTAPCPSPRHALQASASAPGPSGASGAAAQGTRLRSRGPGVPRPLRAGAAREGPAGPRCEREEPGSAAVRARGEGPRRHPESPADPGLPPAAPPAAHLLSPLAQLQPPPHGEYPRPVARRPRALPLQLFSFSSDLGSCGCCFYYYT